MNDEKKKGENIQLEFLKMLRQEILQNSTEGMKALEFGILIISALFTLAISEFVPEEGRWFFFLFPPIVVAPLIMLISQRYKQTRKIGKYIDLRIEPNLELEWERKRSNSEDCEKMWCIPPRSLVAMSMPLMSIQCLSIFASLYYLHSASFGSRIIWAMATIFIGFLLYLEHESIKKAIKEDFSIMFEITS
jgi:hypothetical protein